MTNLRGRCTLLALLLAATAPQSALAAISSRTVAFEYDAATGLLKKEIVEPDNAQLRVDTAYTYDSFGNKTAATVSSPATGIAAVATRSVGVGYDARGQFPVSGKNALNQAVSRTIEPKFGLPTSITDISGLKVQWQYDNFGRRTLATYADGTKTQWTYSYCTGYNGGTATCPSLAIYLIQTTPQNAAGAANGPWTKVYMDALSRAVRTETLGFDGVTSIYQDTSYDRLGRVSRSSRPYYSGQTPQWTTTTYDALGRPARTVAPDGTFTTVGYNGVSVSVTNALNQTRTQTRNTRGEVVTATDAANKSTTYKYDPFGNLLTTTDPVGNVTTLGYDLLGRKISMADPDMGKWTYSYDALGELVRQTDAKSQVSTTTYDLLGRSLSRSEPDLISNWIYDSCINGIGKLCQARADNGYASTPTYDAFGRVAGNTTVIDTSYTTSATFDANGRVATHTYPSGLVVKYVYTPLGYLKEVRNNATNALFWQANSQDAEGNLLQQTYGNGVVTQQVFEASTGRLKNIYAGAGNGVQNFTYGYDPIGQLSSRKDDNQSLNETFLYDNLNRLTTSTVNSGAAGVVTQTFGYDGIGNITSRSDLGAYTYGAVNSRPHGLTSIGLAAGGKRTFGYDLNGNLTQESQTNGAGAEVPARSRAHSYTSFNMPSVLMAPGIGVAMSFVYGPDHQRIRQNAPSGTTFYLHPDNSGSQFYEKENKADGTIEHRQFINAGGSVVAIAKQVGSVTTVSYLHGDGLGSNTAVTNAAGTVVERMAYEPFGKRRAPGGSIDPNNGIVGVNTDRGYTGHEHLDELGLIHMNGRVYDPQVGRFQSADPFIQDPFNGQSFNRYSYVMNSPTNATDPSGYWTGGGFSGFIVNTPPPRPSVGFSAFGWNIGFTVNYSGGSSTVKPPPPPPLASTPAKPVAPVAPPINDAIQAPVVTNIASFGAANAASSANNGRANPNFSGGGAAERGVEQFRADVQAGNGEVYAPFRPVAVGMVGAALGGSSFAALATTATGRTFLASLGFGLEVQSLSEGAPIGGSIRGVNAHTKGATNCGNCSIATDAVLAGRPASALSSRPIAPAVLETHFGAKFGDPTTINGVTAAMNQGGFGARGIVFGSRGSNAIGHYFNVVNQKGMIRYVDGQSGGAASLEGYKSFQLLRTN